MTIDLASHQSAAVEQALTLLHARGGVVLADEVGLGKSFVAAAVAARFSAETEFIVPARLVEQWRATLNAFGVHARITTHDRIVNEPFVPPGGGERLIIVDEAHAFRNPRTQRHDALARRSIAARLMLVTATPICNSPDDLYALASLIASDDALRIEGVPSLEEAFRCRRSDEIAIIIRELVIRRGREVLDDGLRFGALQRTMVRYEMLELGIDGLLFPLVGGSRSLLRSVLWRRLESSEAALLETLRRQKRFYQRALDCLATGRTLTKRDYRMAFGDEDADAFQEVLFWEMFASEETHADAGEIRAELTRIAALRKEVEVAPRMKAERLTKICASTAEPMLIFTSAIATANDLFAALAPIRRTGVITSHRAMPLNAIDSFRCGKLDVLVATDLAAEGLNLQRAGVVVHYDMPWNPVKLDQRNGRAFRIGQEREIVRAIYFVPRGRRTRILQTVAAKNRVRRHLLRGAPPPPAAQAIPSRLALPARLPRTSAAVALTRALQSRKIDAPPALSRRYRAGMERLLAEMSREYVDARRVSDLTSLLERERIIDGGASRGSADR